MTVRSLIAALALGVALVPPAGSTQGPAVRASSGVALAPGTFLVATRNLKDPNFARTVVLLIDYGSDGAMGIVINRRTELTLSDALPDLEPLEPNDKAIFVGGPVSPAGMMMLVRSAEKPGESVAVIDGVWVSQDLDLLESLVVDESPDTDFRLYAGYAGWAPRQLDAEVARGDWYVVSADADTVFSDRPAQIWRSLIPTEDNPYVTGTFPEPGVVLSENRDDNPCGLSYSVL
jgi:putative transcriptional regulator